MSEPMTPGQWRTALRAEGVRFSEYEDWTTHNRNGAGPFSNVNGVIIHHTAGTNSLSLCRNGRSDLPGPLAHAHLAKSGTVTLLSTGRANHAGSGSQLVYSSVLSEVPAPSAGPDAVDGNAHFYGIEIENLGDSKDPYPEAQYEAAVRWVAAICRFHGWSAYSVIGHKEWTTRKIDPTFSMGSFRARVAARLAHDASWDYGQETPVTAQPKPPVSQTYRDIALTDAFPAPRNRDGYAENQYWTLESYLRDIAEGIRINREMLAELLALAKK